jgi:hypothetical protein
MIGARTIRPARRRDALEMIDIHYDPDMNMNDCSHNVKQN